MCALPTCIKYKHTQAHAHTICRSYKPLAEALAMTETTPLLPKTFPPQHQGCPLSPRPHPVPWSSGLWLSLEATSVGSLIPEPVVRGPDDLRTTTSLENMVPTAPGRNLTEPLFPSISPACLDRAQHKPYLLDTGTLGSQRCSRPSF